MPPRGFIPAIAELTRLFGVARSVILGISAAITAVLAGFAQSSDQAAKEIAQGQNESVDCLKETLAYNSHEIIMLLIIGGACGFLTVVALWRDVESPFVVQRGTRIRTISIAAFYSFTAVAALWLLRDFAGSTGVWNNRARNLLLAGDLKDAPPYLFSCLGFGVAAALAAFSAAYCLIVALLVPVQARLLSVPPVFGARFLFRWLEERSAGREAS